MRPRALRVSLSETLRERQLLQVGEPAQRTALTVSRRKRSEPGEVSRSFRAAPKFAMGMPTKRGNAHQEKKMIYELKNGIEAIYPED